MERFNSFYTTVASKHVERLPESICGHKLCEQFYHNKGIIPSSYSFSIIIIIVSKIKVLGYLNNFSMSPATGLDGIPSCFVRDHVL